jgi:hypothetical protein
MEQPAVQVELARTFGYKRQWYKINLTSFNDLKGLHHTIMRRIIELQKKNTYIAKDIHENLGDYKSPASHSRRLNGVAVEMRSEK